MFGQAFRLLFRTGTSPQFLLLVHFIRVRALLLDSRFNGYDMLKARLPFADPVLNSITVCENTLSLNKQQLKLCREKPDVFANALQGVQIAIHECQHQFRFRRWNCSSMDKKNKNPLANSLLSRGFRETAFLNALISSSIVQSIATSCSMGKLKSCGCEKRASKGPGWTWGGCGDNINYGAKFAAKFMDTRETGRDIHSLMNIHNNRAGRQLVKEYARTNCKCKGVSGSCSIRTCWKSVPVIRQIGNILNERYEYAILIKVGNKNKNKPGKLKPVQKRFKRSALQSELVYFERSPSFCEPIPTLEIPGTRGRVCSTDSLDTDNCNHLCCGRKHAAQSFKVVTKCRCHFNWCCYVICQRCEELVNSTVCN